MDLIDTALLTDKQLEILGFENNTIWLGHKDGEDFEIFIKTFYSYKDIT